MPKPVRPRKPRPSPSRPAAAARPDGRSKVRSSVRPGASPAAAVGAIWAERLLWILVLLPPLLVVPTAREAFRLPKLLAAEWLALASLIPLAWQLARRAPAPAVSGRDLLRHPAVLALLPLLLVAAAGFLTTRHPLHLREALADLWIGAACLIGWSLGLAAGRLERLLRGLLIPAAVLAAIAILQAHGLWQPFEFVVIAGASRLGITATAGNPGDLGAYLVLPALLGQWQVARASRGRWATAGALVLILYALARTQTLAALAALGLASLVLWAGLVPRRRRLPLLAAVIVAALLPLAYAPLRVRVVEKAEQALAGDWNAVLTGRLDGWRAAAYMLGEHPLAGVGHGAYRPEFVPAKLALLERGTPFLSAPLQVVFANAHNEILEAGAEWGVPGLLALLWGLGVLLAAARRACRAGRPWRRSSVPADPDPEPLDRAGPLIAAGLTALGVLALAHFPFRIALTAFPALLFLAWVLRRAEEAAPVEQADGPPRPAPDAAGGAGPGLGLNRGLAWAALAVLILALGFQTVRLRDRLLASSLLRGAETRTLAAAATGRIASTVLQENLLDLERAARLDPVEVGIPLARGSQFLLMRRADAALESYERALALEPRPEIYLNRGRARLLAGQAAAAGEDFALAARLDPALNIPQPPQPTAIPAPTTPPPLIPFLEGGAPVGEGPGA
jgi:O-antigen ligase